MKGIVAKLFARRLASLLGPPLAGKAPAIPVLPTTRSTRDDMKALEALDTPAAELATPSTCELCDTEWGGITVDEIAELLVQSGRFPDEQRAALLSLSRERLVSVFCGCSASLRLAPPPPAASVAPRPVRR